jgi:hypothetical protein
MPSKLISPIQSKPERIVFADASSFAGAGFKIVKLVII